MDNTLGGRYGASQELLGRILPLPPTLRDPWVSLLPSLGPRPTHLITTPSPNHSALRELNCEWGVTQPPGRQSELFGGGSEWQEGDHDSATSEGRVGRPVTWDRHLLLPGDAERSAGLRPGPAAVWQSRCCCVHPEKLPTRAGQKQHPPCSPPTPLPGRAPARALQCEGRSPCGFHVLR